MQELKIKNKGQARLFHTRYLEVFTKTSPQVIFSIYVHMIIAMLVYSVAGLNVKWYFVVGYYFFGMFFWTFFEYIMHRFVFHMHPEGESVKKIVYTAHGVHHEYPRDKDRLFMPPLPSLLLAVI